MDEQVLLKAGADVNAQDRDGWTPLIYATDGERVGVVEVTAQHLSMRCSAAWIDRFFWTTEPQSMSPRGVVTQRFTRPRATDTS